MTTFTPDQLRAALEKHGLPIYGTDEELQTRYDRNFNAPKPVETKSFRGRPKGVTTPKVAPDELKNELLANRVAVEYEAPVAEEVTSENVNSDEIKDA